MWFSCFLRIFGLWSARVKGAKAENRVQKTVNTMDTMLLEPTSGSQLNFIPEYRKYIGLGTAAEESPNLH